MKSNKPEKELDKMVKELISNAPKIEGYSIQELTDYEDDVCPTCGSSMHPIDVTIPPRSRNKLYKLKKPK